MEDWTVGGTSAGSNPLWNITLQIKSRVLAAGLTPKPTLNKTGLVRILLANSRRGQSKLLALPKSYSLFLKGKHFKGNGEHPFSINFISMISFSYTAFLLHNKKQVKVLQKDSELGIPDHRKQSNPHLTVTTESQAQCTFFPWSSPLPSCLSHQSVRTPPTKRQSINIKLLKQVSTARLPQGQ